jgi:hypothetical protein
MRNTLFHTLARELGRLLEPISDAVAKPRLLDRLLAGVGAQSPVGGGDALVTALAAVVDIKEQLDVLAAQPTPSLDDLAALLEASKRAFAAIRTLSAPGGPAAALQGFGRDLVDLLVAIYLVSWHPLARRLAALAALLEPADELPPRPRVAQGGQLLRGPFVMDRFHLDRVASLLHDPVETLRTEYGRSLATVADANAMAGKLFPRMVSVLRELNVLCRHGFRRGDEALLGDTAPLLDHALIIYVDSHLTGAVAEAGVVLVLSSADRGDLGLVVSPFGALTTTRRVGQWKLEFELTGDVDAFAIGPRGLTLMASSGVAEIVGRAAATLAAPTERPAFVIGAPTGTRLEVGGAQLAADLQVSGARRAFGLSASVSRAAFIIAPGDGDGVLQRILPADGLRAEIDLGVAWSSEHGLQIKGGAGLNATLPAHATLGPVGVDTVHVAVVATAQEVRVEMTCAARFALGPLEASIDGVGLAAKLSFPEAGGNLGIADLDFKFQPPRGIGVVIDAGVVKGGGFLLYDPLAKRYAGALSLALGSRFTLAGIGLMEPTATGKTSTLLLATLQMPPANPGFSVTGVGAFVALNRAGAPDELMKALSSGDLDAVLFPADPIARAGQILATLGRFFPAKDDHHVVGLLLQLVFGGATRLIVGELAVLVEVGSSRSDLQAYLVLQGRLELPGPAKKAFSINVEGFGHWDVGRGELELRLELRESKIFGADLGGEGLVLYYRVDATPALGDGSDAFADAQAGHRQLFISLGGYHPDYRPPARAVVGERLALTVKKGDWLRFEVQQYVALTPGAFHFGADASLLVKFDPLEIRGDLGFDALIGFDWSFDIAIHASMSIRFHGHDLCGVAVEMSLVGPGPTVIKGKVSISILWWDITKSFCKELSSEPASAQAAPDVAQLLRDALGRPESWGNSVIDGVALARRARPATTIWASPTRPLRLAQTIVPLDVQIDRYGPARLAPPRSFTVDHVRLGDASASVEPTTPIQGEFGRALYIDLSDQEKLGADGFDALTAGFEVAAGGFSFGPDVVSSEDYEEIVVPRRPSQPPRLRPIGPLLIEAARLLSPLATAAPIVPRVVVQPRRFVAVDAVDGQRRRLTDAAGLPYTLARQAARLARRPGLPAPRIVRFDEIAGGIT